eukprot:Seg2482.5 transcript_id=Seg2482.5/GoldUCD/mRNA.D3Y31 product="AP-3 complex subunit delta-1" protein_id=Seg2482.5/GoldUCD/D3Y31
MFEKNLNDLVRGIRNNKNNEAKYINQCLEDIKQELRQENMNIKANAVAKLIYLEMHGYDISWAAFNMIEVMSSTKFTHKRIGYLASSQCFHEELDVLMLTTNLVKKDMASQNQYDAGVAMNGLSVFITPDLARDLANDVMNQMVSSRSYMRKKSVLLMYKVFLNFPEALRPAFPRLKEKLEDQDPGVQCSAVNVICELARKNPRNYLSLAPLFFKLMTTSSNNWMLIKIIKLFGALCPLEPRLGKKLMEPLTNLIHSTSAMSLLYECINTVIFGLSDHMPSIQLCVSKLRLLIEDPDQNLKYLGLFSLNKILAKVPKAVQPHKDLILQCLDDRDESIRYRALDLIVGMISKKTLVDIVKKLMIHLEKAEGSGYRDELLAKIIQICSQSNYQYVTNFEWYIDCLVQLSNVENTKHGKLIASQMLDVAIRVRAVRSYAVKTLSHLLDRINLLSSGARKDGTCEVLHAAAWIAGEFSEHLDDLKVRMESLLHTRASSLPGHIQGVYVQNIAKLYSRIITKAEQEDDTDTVVTVGKMIQEKIPMFTQSSNLEVQERACCLLQLVSYVLKMAETDGNCAELVAQLFAEELLPVAAKAQKKVPVPEGLDLEKWINEPPSDSSDDEDIEQSPFFADDKTSDTYTYQDSKTNYRQLTTEESEKAKEARQQMQASNPHYLKMDSRKTDDISVDDIPVANLDLPVKLHVEGKDRSKKGKKKRRRKGKHAEDSSEDEQNLPTYEIMTVEGAEDEEDGQPLPVNDPHRQLNIDLDAPLEAHEVLPVRTHRIAAETKDDEEPDKAPTKDTAKKKSKKDKKNSSKEKRSKKKHERSDSTAKPKSTEKASSHKKKRTKSRDKDEKDTESSEPTSPTPSKATLLAQASELKKRGSAGRIATTENGVGHEDEKNLDDMDFWLSSTDATPETNAVAETTNTILPSADQNGKAEEESQKVPDESTKEITKPEKAKEKKKHKEKKEKKEKKGKKKSKKETVETPVQQETSDALLMDSEVTNVDPHAHYLLLGEDSNLKMVYDIKVDPREQSQAIASVIFSNLTNSQLVSLEFNVLDSLNMKMHRNLGDSPHDPVKVPFQLPSGTVNEGQFAFTVESVIMPQWLRGTVTYIIKGTDGSTSEKIDFKINFPVSSFIVQTPVHRTYFANLLAGGTLTEKQSANVDVPADLEFKDIIGRICSKMHTTVVESVENGASIYGYTIQHHEILLLVKQKTESTISVDAKSTDFQLLGSILNEVKLIFKS